MILRIVKDHYSDSFENRDLFIYSVQVKKSFLGIKYWKEIGSKTSWDSALKLLNEYKEAIPKEYPKVIYSTYYKE